MYIVHTNEYLNFNTKDFYVYCFYNRIDIRYPLQNLLVRD